MRINWGGNVSLMDICSGIDVNPSGTMTSMSTPSSSSSDAFFYTNDLFLKSF